MKKTTLFLLIVASCAWSEPASISRSEILASLRYVLLDMHGGASALPRYAEQLERERGFTRVEMKELLLEIAEDESWDVFARNNAIVEFIEMARPEELSRLDPFYESTNDHIRAQIQYFLLEQLQPVPEKLAYARRRLDWLADNPQFQKDAKCYGIFFQGFLHYSNPTESEKDSIVDFFRNTATNATFFESAYEADMLLARYDPAWTTNETRRAMLRKWIDDPGIHGKSKALWTDVLASFDISQTSTSEPCVTEHPSIPCSDSFVDKKAD